MGCAFWLSGLGSWRPLEHIKLCQINVFSSRGPEKTNSQNGTNPPHETVSSEQLTPELANPVAKFARGYIRVQPTNLSPVNGESGSLSELQMACAGRQAGSPSLENPQQCQN